MSEELINSKIMEFIRKIYFGMNEDNTVFFADTNFSILKIVMK